MDVKHHVYQKPTFDIVHFCRTPFTCSSDGGGGEEGLNDFKFGTFIGRFLSDDAASMAVKGFNLFNAELFTTRYWWVGGWGGDYTVTTRMAPALTRPAMCAKVIRQCPQITQFVKKN